MNKKWIKCWNKPEFLGLTCWTLHYGFGWTGQDRLASLDWRGKERSALTIKGQLSSCHCHWNWRFEPITSNGSCKKRKKNRENTTILPNGLWQFSREKLNKLFWEKIVKLQQFRTTLISREKLRKNFRLTLDVKATTMMRQRRLSHIRNRSMLKTNVWRGHSHIFPNGYTIGIPLNGFPKGRIGDPSSRF